VTAYRLAGGQQRAEVRLVGLVDGRGHGDDDDIGLADFARIVRRHEPRCGAQIVRRDLAGRIHEGTVGRYLLVREVEADGVEQLAELDGERQPDVTQPDDGHRRLRQGPGGRRRGVE
jgi:hypothetical protein